MHDEVAAAGGVAGAANVDAQPVGDLGPGAVHVDEGHVDAGEAGEQSGHRAADHAGSDHRDPVADERRRVPERVDGGLHRPREHGPGGRHVLRHDRDGGGRHDVRRLVRVEAEDGAAQ